MLNYIGKKIKKFQAILSRFFFGETIEILNARVEKSEKTIEFLSSLLGEQSRLIASIALIQNDIAESIDLGSGRKVEDGSIYLKISAADDEFLN